MKTSTTSTTTESAHEIENESFWKRHLKLQKESGLSRTKYCRINNLNYERFGYGIHIKMNPTSGQLFLFRDHTVLKHKWSLS